MEKSELPAWYVAHLDGLVSEMQTDDARRAFDALFEATPRQLGEAAVRGARVSPADADDESCQSERK